jgi:hypothetical protein
VLRERIFEIGGGLCIVTGILLLAGFALNPTWLLWGFIEAGGLLIGFGVLFLYVGRGSRRDRLRLLESPKPPQ